MNVVRVLAGIAMLAMALRAEAGRVYVTNERGGDVTVIDTGTNKVIATIPVGKRPRGIHLSADGKTAYVALSGSPISGPGAPKVELPVDRKADGIGVIDTAAGKLTTVLPSGVDPEQFSLSKDESLMYISNEDANAITVLDIRKRMPIRVLPVGHEPEGVTTGPDGREVYTTSETTNEIHIIETETNTISAHLKTEERPRSVAFLPDGTKAYVTCESGGAICVIDVKKREIIKKLMPAGKNVRPMGAVVGPDGKNVYITTGRGQTVLVIDAIKDEVTGVVENVGARPWGIGITGDGSMLYTANGPSNDVSVIDVKTMKVVERIKAGNSPWGIAISD
jgi:YVTN family beta-propeller protein